MLKKCYGVGICTNRKSTHDFVIPLTTKLYLYLLPFRRNANVKLWPVNSTPVLSVRVDLRGRKWYLSKSRPDIAIRVPCTPLTYLALFGHNTQRGRQTDLAISIGQQCNSFIDLKRYCFVVAYTSLVPDPVTMVVDRLSERSSNCLSAPEMPFSARALFPQKASFLLAII